MNDVKYVGIIDDHAMFRKGLAHLINLFPTYKVLFDASNGKEMMDYLKEGKLPDILLLDIAMPVMDGYAAAKWLQAHHPAIKVLALSTMDTDTAIIKMLKNGAKGYLLKDAEPEELKKAFDEVTGLGYYSNNVVSRKIIQSMHQLTRPDGDLELFSRLTDREMDFLRLACSEKTYMEIAREMFVSERTVDGYRDALFKKLHITSRVGLAIYAIRNGIVKL